MNVSTEVGVSHHRFIEKRDRVVVVLAFARRYQKCELMETTEKNKDSWSHAGVLFLELFLHFAIVLALAFFSQRPSVLVDTVDAHFWRIPNATPSTSISRSEVESRFTMPKSQSCSRLTVSTSVHVTQLCVCARCLLVSRRVHASC